MMFGSPPGQRRVVINATFLVDLVRQDSTHPKYTVKNHGVPANARLVSITVDEEVFPSTITLVVESAQWAPVDADEGIPFLTPEIYVETSGEKDITPCRH